VFREHWREREFWAWWWQTQGARQVARNAAAAAAFVALCGFGLFVAIRVSSAEKTSKTTVLWQTITVKQNRVGAPAQTVTHDRTVLRYVTTARKPGTVVLRRVVTTVAMVTTVVESHTVMRSTPLVMLRTVTQPRRVTETLTRPVTVASPPVTVTETLPAETVFVTVTVKHGH
jgi:hypothetical protein